MFWNFRLEKSPYLWIFEDQDQYLEGIAQFFREGEDKKEWVIFVASKEEAQLLERVIGRQALIKNFWCLDPSLNFKERLSSISLPLRIMGIHLSKESLLDLKGACSDKCLWVSAYQREKLSDQLLPFLLTTHSTLLWRGEFISNPLVSSSQKESDFLDLLGKFLKEVTQKGSFCLELFNDLNLPALLLEGDLVVDLNQEMEKLTGYPREKAVGESWWNLLCLKENYQKVREHLRKCSQGSFATSSDTIYLKNARGKLREMVFRAINLPEGARFILVLQDVTAVRGAYRLLRLISKTHSKRVLSVKSRDELLKRLVEIIERRSFPEIVNCQKGDTEFPKLLEGRPPVRREIGTPKSFLRVVYHSLEALGYRKALEEALEETIGVISQLVEVRDPYTAGHQQRVSAMACAIAKKMGLSEKSIERIRIAGLLHDVGKIGIPTDILNKPVPLSHLEFEMIKTHPKLGYEIVSRVHFLQEVATIILEHHERLDGSGYPQGLKGGAISLEARVLAVADVAEAMSSHRAYRPLLPKEEVVSEFQKKRGKLYDPQVVDAFLELIEGLPHILCLEMEGFD